MSAVNSILNLLRFNKKNWRAVVLCLIAATVFWFFNALNKTYTTILSFPVEFQYDQDNFVPVADLPTEVKMNVTGMGWTLIRRSAGIKVPALLLPLEHPTEVKKVVGSTLPVLLGNQVSDLQINFVATDTLRLDIEPLTGRWLSLTIAAPAFKNGYGISSKATLTPDSIFIQGPRRKVDALPDPYPVKLPFKSIDESVDESVTVTFDYPRFNIEQPYVNVSFQTERLKEVRDSVKVEIINVPPALRRKLALHIKEIHYTFQVPESVWQSGYNRNNIRSTLNLKPIKEGKTHLAPSITGLPPFATIVKIDSVEVSY